MTTLQQTMATYGFESNEHYDYVVRCLYSAPGPAIRCLNIEGDMGRRNTAFGNALANALEPKHLMYYDFTQTQSKVPIINNSDVQAEAGKVITEFDKVMSDVCAFSEAEKTILILDQLQAADFKEHIRVYQFLIEHKWQYSDAEYYANRDNLLIFLISEQPLYHSLQKHSFSVWISAGALRNTPFKPQDFNLGEEANVVMDKLSEIFVQLNVSPTFSEYQKILYDIQNNVLSVDDLKMSIYGWTEGVNRDFLYSKKLSTLFESVMSAIEGFIGVDETLELGQDSLPVEQTAK